MKLSKEDFNKLEELLTKIGFGSYYDLIELLKMTICNLDPTFASKIMDETDLQTIAVVLNRITQVRKEKPKP